MSNTLIKLTNLETDGAKPVMCRLRIVEDKLLLYYGGARGIEIEVPMDAIRKTQEEEMERANNNRIG